MSPRARRDGARAFGARPVAGAPAALLLTLVAGCRADPVGVAPAAAAGRIAAARGAAAGSTGDTIPGRWIVVLRGAAPRVGSASDGTGVADVARGLAAAHRGEVVGTFTTALRGFAAELPAEEIEALRADPSVASVEPDRVVGIAESAPIAESVPAVTWGLDRIDQRLLPLDGRYTYVGGSTGGGAGVYVYVFDTGIYAAHTEFGGRAAGVYSTVVDANGTFDCHGHGTHVAGTIGGATVGVARQVRLRAVRVLDCGGKGSTSGLVSAIDWTLQHAVRPAVFNMSLNGTASAALNQAVARVVAAGIPVVVAAGNDHTNACTTSPAGEPTALTVGATGATDTQASFSNVGPCLDLYAPGVSIKSAARTGPTAYATMSGTSMAAPHVAGAAALVLGADPVATPADVARAILDHAAPGLVRAAGAGSPNLLLQTDGLAVPPVVVLATVVPVSGIAVPSWTLPVGSTARVSAQLFQATGGLADAVGRAVRFVSNAPKVASVDSLTGQVRAVSVGKFRIVARVDGLVAATPTAYVTPTAATPVVTVRIVKVAGIGSDATLAVGGTASFGVSLYGTRNIHLSPIGRTVRWSTNNPTVARVDAVSGEVRALKAGRFVVRATVGGVTGGTGHFTVP